MKRSCAPVARPAVRRRPAPSTARELGELQDSVWRRPTSCSRPTGDSPPAPEREHRRKRERRPRIRNQERSIADAVGRPGPTKQDRPCPPARADSAMSPLPPLRARQPLIRLEGFDPDTTLSARLEGRRRPTD
ncbi:MAG: hypothetical protein ACLRM8_04480 [Alistipes sp.]